MLKTNKRKTTIITMALACACFVSGGLSSILVKADEPASNLLTVQGVTYNADDFTVTQDYGAYVDGTVYSGDAVGAHARWLGKVGSKVRLDAGRNGLLFTSKVSGDDAVGKAVTLANKQLGDFSMDFRVFSKESAVGGAYVEASEGLNANDYARDALYDDRHNPFQDIRRLDITFTSISNPDKYFTVNIFGNDTLSWTDCSASVYVVGDSIQTAENIFGYGICADCGTACYGNTGDNHKTRLYGNTFTNSTNNTSSAPTSIWFDQENMKVYAKSYNQTLQNNGANGVVLEEEYRLIRDMRSNALSGAYTLNSEDFEAGYTVDIAVGDMTSNATALKQPTWNTNCQWGGLADATNPSPYYRNAAVDFDVDGNGTVDTNYTYDRYANFIIYNINGAEMDIKDGWTVEETTLTTATAGKRDGYNGGPFVTNPTWEDFLDEAQSALPQFGYAPGDVLQGLKFTSKVNNNGVVGEGFNLNVDDFTNTDGAFAMKIGAEFDYTKATTVWNTANGINTAERGLGDYAEAIDQYSDVKELKVTFRSTVDPTKAFNIYMVSRTATNNAMSIYTEIEGENYINNSLHRGWALPWNYTAFSAGTPFGDSQGTFGSRTVNTYGETDDTYSYPLIKFDPTTMNIYGFSGGYVRTYRNLGVAYSVAGARSATLDSSYFYDTTTNTPTYSVSVSVERMNTKENVGVNTMQSWNGSWTHPTVNVYKDGAQGAPTEGWDHTAVIHVYKLYGDKTAEGYDLPVSTATFRTPTTAKTELNLGNQSLYEVGLNGIALDVSVMDAFGEISIPESVAYSGPATGTIELTDGVGNFMPSVLGEYIFTVGNMTRRLSVVDTTAPVVTLNSTAQEMYYTDKIDVGFNDITITDNYDLEFVQSFTIYKNDKVVNKINGLGTYTIKYFVKDGSGNSTTYDRVINVVDNTAPIVTVGNHPTEYIVGDMIYLPVITATDDFDNNPQIVYQIFYNEEEVTIVNDMFMATKAGEYKISVFAKDASGNESQTTTTVFVSETNSEINDDLGTNNEQQNYVLPILLIAIPSTILVVFAVLMIICFRKKRNK